MLKRMTDIAAMAMLAMAAGGGLVGAQAQTPAQTDELTVRSRAVAADFQDKLRGQLMAALKTGGPLLALDVCQKAAPAIAEEVGARAGAKVWRTSLKARNPRGTPDAWERSVLEQFDARRAAGEDPATIEASARTPTGFRYMKAIPMAEPCAQCHGVTIAPEVAAKIAALYPQDRATGFAPGTLRGAVSITWPAAR
jgi:hypothetical protein